MPVNIVTRLIKQASTNIGIIPTVYCDNLPITKEKL